MKSEWDETGMKRMKWYLENEASMRETDFIRMRRLRKCSSQQEIDFEEKIMHIEMSDY